MAKLIAFDSPFIAESPAFFTGLASSSETPLPYDVAIDGIPFMIEWDHNAIGVWGAKFKNMSLPLLRNQADQSNTPGEQSISPEQLWRRSQDSWHYGAGQDHLDRATSEIRRFQASKGVNVWTPWKLSLLNDTSKKVATAGTSLAVCTVGSVAVMIDGTGISKSSNLTSWTAFTGVSATAGKSIDTDGSNIYVANQTDGVYSGAVSGTTVTKYATGTADLVRYVNGRLMVAGSGKLYNLTAGGAFPTALLDLSAKGFTWVDICGGQTQIYAAGYSGDKSSIYRTAIKADGTALDVPIVAATLPDGEIVRSLSSYQGFVLIGSDLGVRFASVASDGSLTIGALISTSSAVYCFEPQDRFVWYGLSNYDGTSTGLGRIDLSIFTGTLLPAYASDIMATDQGVIRSVATFNNYRIFTVEGKGLYAEVVGTPVASGYLDTGIISYGISDTKIAMFFDLKHKALVGTVDVSLSADDNALAFVGESNTVGSVSPPIPLSCGQTQGEEFNFRITLNSNVTSPILTRWTLRSAPTPQRTTQWDVPVIISERQSVGTGERYVKPAEQVAYLKSLYKSQKIVSLQIGAESVSCFLYDFDWLPERKDDQTGIFGGNFYAQFREIVG